MPHCRAFVRNAWAVRGHIYCIMHHACRTAAVYSSPSGVQVGASKCMWLRLARAVSDVQHDALVL